jgi:hypothetical protein
MIESWVTCCLKQFCCWGVHYFRTLRYVTGKMFTHTLEKYAYYLSLLARRLSQTYSKQHKTSTIVEVVISEGNNESFSRFFRTLWMKALHFCIWARLLKQKHIIRKRSVNFIPSLWQKIKHNNRNKHRYILEIYLN